MGAKFKRLVKIKKQLKIERDGLMALAVLTNDVSYLRLSKSQLQRLQNLKVPINFSPDSDIAEQKSALYYMQADNFRDGVIMAWVDACASEDDKGWTALYRLAQLWQPPIFPLSGKDLLAAGFSSGKEVGAVLKLLEQKWVNSGFQDQKADLLIRVNGLRN